jgi:hypothetical protein
MVHPIIVLFYAIFGALFNRMSGTQRWMYSGVPDDKLLPGRPIYYTAPLFGFMAWILMSWKAGLIVAVGILFWRLFSWGYLQLLGRRVPGKGPEPFEAALLRIAGGNVHGALVLRHSFAFPTAYYLIGWPGLVIGLVFATVYEAAWVCNPKNPIWIAEIAVGAMWGAMIAIGAFYG